MTAFQNTSTSADVVEYEDHKGHHWRAMRNGGKVGLFQRHGTEYVYHDTLTTVARRPHTIHRAFFGYEGTKAEPCNGGLR